MIQTTVNDTMVYNDSIVCRQAHYFREAQQEWEQKTVLKGSKEKLNLQVYPNPFTGILQWRITGEHSDGVLTIKDIMGKSISIENISLGLKEGSIDLSGLSQGIYLLSYADKDFVATKKIVKQ